MQSRFRWCSCDQDRGRRRHAVGPVPVRRLWFRSDRVHVQTAIPCQPILRTHGWCDDPASGLYNRPFRLPAHVSHERLYRRDRLYDLVLTIGHNDSPARAGGGSAIFVHVQPENDAATAGCIAPSRDDLIWLLARLRPGDMFRVHPGVRIGQVSATAGLAMTAKLWSFHK